MFGECSLLLRTTYLVLVIIFASTDTWFQVVKVERAGQVGLMGQPAVTSPVWFRLGLSVVVGAFFAVLLVRQSLPRGYEAADLTAVLNGARDLLAGRSPFLPHVASD